MQFNTRRDFIKKTSLATFSIGVSDIVVGKSFDKDNSYMDKPNIILILTDQHRLSAIGAYGKTACKTPNLDKLAEQGTLFVNNYTSCPLCSPARATIMTGQHVHKHKMCANAGEINCKVSNLIDDKELLSRRLLATGYQCGYTGKWHLGTKDKDASIPTNCGFEGMDVYGHGDGGHTFEGYQDYLKQNRLNRQLISGERPQKITGRFGVEQGGKETCVGHYLTNHTISMIDEFCGKQAPFFIWHNYWGPHEPYYAPKEFMEMYEGISIEEWENFNWKPDNDYGPDRMKRNPIGAKSPWAVWENVVKHYYAFTTYIDYEIGRIVAHLEHKGIADNTIIMFTSDHGETLGSHGGMVDKGWSHFEEIQRTGFIIKDPRVEKNNKGRRIEELTSLVDLYPTILDYAHADYDDKDIDGKSVKGFVEGEKMQWRDTVIVEFYGIGHMATNMITCRYKNFKYGYTCSNKDELYDLDKDPYEMNNLIDSKQYVNIVEMMRKRIYTFMQEKHYPGYPYFSETRMFGYDSYTLPDVRL